MGFAESTKTFLPFFAWGKVVHGFGRGSKQLGCPTANFAEDIVKQLPAGFENGVYYGWASVNNGTVFKAVMSVGLNDTFKNSTKSIETHIISEFDHDFYDSLLKIVIVGFIRQMRSFSSMDELKLAIADDISKAKSLLDITTAEKTLNGTFILNANEADFTVHSFFRTEGERLLDRARTFYAGN